MKVVLKWITSNLPLMILALVLATLAWIVATEQGDPTVEETFAQPIPVLLSDPPEGLVVVQPFNQTVNMTVRTTESIWQTLTSSDFLARVDLTGLEPGIHTLPIDATIYKQPATLTWEPQQITIEMEPLVEKTVLVNVQIEGEPALGYLSYPAVFAPQEVTVSGPESYIAQVVEATTQVSIQDAEETIEGEFSLQAIDESGSIVNNVTLTPRALQVNIPIALSGNYRALNVVPDTEGAVAPGYRITYVSVEPPVVTVRGDSAVIAALPGYLETEPVNVEGAQADVIRRPALNVPQGIAIVSDRQVTVTVFIEAIQSSLTLDVIPELQGLSTGLTATVSPETIEVILGGPMPQLESLESEDISVILDLFDLPRGIHQVEPQIVVPEGITAQSIIPSTVEVEIISTLSIPNISSPTATVSPTTTPSTEEP